MYTVESLKEIFIPVFKQEGVRKATLFGSYAKGCAVEESDIDLVVDTGRRGLAFFGVVDALNESIDKPVEVFDTSMIIQGSELETELKNTGVLLYEE